MTQGGGDNDVCTDLGDNEFYNELGSGGDYRDCETCFGPDNEELNCDTGRPEGSPAPTDTAAKTECLSGKGPYEGVTDFCGPGGADRGSRRRRGRERGRVDAVGEDVIASTPRTRDTSRRRRGRPT